MNQLEENKVRNEYKYHLWNLHEKLDFNFKVSNKLKSFIMEIIKDAVYEKSYIEVSKTVSRRFNSGRVRYYSNSMDIKLKSLFLNNINNKYTDLTKIRWHCNLVNHDSTDVKISIDVYDYHGHGGKQFFKFDRVINLDDVLYIKKFLFIKRPAIDYNYILELMEVHEEEIKAIIIRSFDGIDAMAKIQ